MADEPLAVTSCGVLVARRDPALAFLLLRFYRNLDLPKGVRESGEDDRTCALRELREEAGIEADALDLSPGFRFTATYPSSMRGRGVIKTLVVFLGTLVKPVTVRLSPEHHGYLWLDWPPARPVGSARIQQLLEEAAAYLADAQRGNLPPR